MNARIKETVIPAKAGIQFSYSQSEANLDSRLRGNDGDEVEYAS
jgi:hypothetical protein